MELLELKDFTKSDVAKRFESEYISDLKNHTALHKYYNRWERVKVGTAILGMFLINIGLTLAGMMLLATSFLIVADMRLDNKYYDFIKYNSTFEDWVKFHYPSLLLLNKKDIVKAKLIVHEDRALISITQSNVQDGLGMTVKMILKDGISHPIIDMLNGEMFVSVLLDDGIYNIEKIL